MKWIITCLVLLALPVWADGQTVALGDRSYLIEVPAQAQGAPIILALHGGGGNPKQFARNSGLTSPALARGYAVIYPAGTGLGRLGRLAWNGGYCCGAAARGVVDDVAFLDAVIADASGRFGLDASRVYVKGISNGGLMAEVYAAARPGRIRAAASVSGSMDMGRTSVSGPVPILIVHGTADTQVPFAGGVGTQGKQATDWASVDQVIAAFVKAARVPLQKTKNVIDPVKDDTRVVATDYTDARGKVMVRLLAIEGGGHVWPGGRRAARDGGTADMDANTEVLRFFALHP